MLEPHMKVRLGPALPGIRKKQDCRVLPSTITFWRTTYATMGRGSLPVSADWASGFHRFRYQRHWM